MAGQSAKMVPVLRGEISNTQSRPLNGHPPSIVLCGDDETGVTEYLETYRSASEDREMTISRPKTQFIDFNLGQDNGQGRAGYDPRGRTTKRVHHFKYMGTSTEMTGGMATEMSLKVSAAWRNWKRCSGVLCDRRMPAKLKINVYKKNCGQTSSVVWCKDLGNNEQIVR